MSPAIFLKLFQDWAGDERDRKIKRELLKKKEKGATGGIRVVLPSVPVDPLLRPGQPRRGLRLLGQDPSKPIEPRGAPSATEPGTTPAASHEPRDFVFGLNFRHGVRARHPVNMTRHQGRDGCGAASASRLSRRRSFFFMPTT